MPTLNIRRIRQARDIGRGSTGARPNLPKIQPGNPTQPTRKPRRPSTRKPKPKPGPAPASPMTEGPNVRPQGPPRATTGQGSLPLNLQNNPTNPFGPTPPVQPTITTQRQTPTPPVLQPGPGGPSARQKTQEENRIRSAAQQELEQLGVPSNIRGRIVNETLSLFRALKQLSTSLRPYL